MKLYLRYYLALFCLTGIFLSAASQVRELRLSDALSMALENNYGIRITSSETEIASINNNWGTAGRFPTIGIDASSVNNYDLNDNSMENNLGAGVGMDWLLFSGFRVNITKDKLESLQTLSEGRLAVVIESTIEDVILAYYDVLLQKEVLDVLKTVTGLSQDRYDYEMARHALGGTVTYNVLQAKNVYLNDKALFMNQEVEVRNTIRNLNFLLGNEPSTLWEFPDPFEADTTSYVLSDLMDKMLSNNQTLQNQYSNLLLSQKETGLRKSLLYPSVSLSTGLENAYRITESGSSTSLPAYGNVRLSWDLYTGGTRKRAIEVARINEEIADVEIKQMEHSLTNQMLNLYDFYNIRIALLEVANESMDAAELNMSISDEKFRSGAINSFNYRDVQLIYLNSALGRLRAIYNLIGSRAALTRLTGGFLTYPEQ